MILNTQRLFRELLDKLEIEVVCDVGSMDGADALAFRGAIPESSVYAFEPNPRNLALMRENPALGARNILIVPMAVANFDGEGDFFLVDADYSRPDYRRGMSSLHRRSDEWAPAAIVPVAITRLDTFLIDRCPAAARLALWIDSEGKAHEVIEGMAAIADRVRLLHVEVETSACIGANQNLYPDVTAQLRRLGFSEMATDQPTVANQFNVLFVRADLPHGVRFRVKAWQIRAWVRYRIVKIIRSVCPACLRRYREMRSAN
jgi:FkbM family methyltransferase